MPEEGRKEEKDEGEEEEKEKRTSHKFQQPHFEGWGTINRKAWWRACALALLAFYGKKILTILTSCEVYFGLTSLFTRCAEKGLGPAQAQRACHTCLGLLDLPGSISLAWVHKSSMGL